MFSIKLFPKLFYFLHLGNAVRIFQNLSKPTFHTPLTSLNSKKSEVLHSLTFLFLHLVDVIKLVREKGKKIVF